MQQTAFFAGDRNPQDDQADRAGGDVQPNEPLKQCVYQSLTYVDDITPQETVWIKGSKVIGITIHNFMTAAPQRIAPAVDGKVSDPSDSSS